jgi:hypothetical protein
MLRKTLSTILVAIVCNVPALAANNADLVANERIGDLHIGGSEKELRKSVVCPLEGGAGWTSATLLPAGDPRLFGPVKHHRELDNVACGIKVGMVGSDDSRMSIDEIAVFAPSNLGTKKGIRIGSTEQDVMKAYASDWNRQADETGKAFVAGTVERGLIFYFENGRVIKILLRSGSH